MLTKRQIEDWSRIDNVGLEVVERDYVQNVFLYLLYKKTSDFIFKGGTCLRICYGSPRYSEDLDFNYNFEMEKGREILQEVVSRMTKFGVGVEIRNEKGKENVGFGFDMSYKGPLYDGRDMTKSKVRVDVSLRKEKVDTQKILIKPRYDDISEFSIISLTLKHVFAGKTRALVTRGKPRDLWDVWYLFKRGEKLDMDLVNERLKLYDEKFNIKTVEKNILALRKVWERDLMSLLPRVPKFDEVKKEILQNLKKYA